MAERLLDDDPPPPAVMALVVQAHPAELADDLGELRRLGREVEQAVAPRPLVLVKLVQRLGQRVEPGRIARSPGGGSGSWR